MTQDELKAQINAMKILAFDNIVMARDIDPKFTGHLSKEHRALWFIAEAAKQIEKLIVKWERNNP